MTEIDPTLKALAFVAANGELAWRRRDVEKAIDAISRSGRAILGWEVWLTGDGQAWTGLIPSADGGPPGVWSFNTSARMKDEEWSHYCMRTASETHSQIQSQPVEAETSPEAKSALRFNLTYVERPARSR
ncbi:MAG: hypothetical protein JNK16_02870 [Phycisphaerales bacterium]|nr:hypothetical protein [Phycisphaerales bacterium]